MPVEDWDAKVGLLAGGHLAPAIGLDRFKEYSGQVRTAGSHFVEDGHGTDEARKAPLFGRLQAEESDHVARVRVVVLPLSGLVDANVRILTGEPHVFDVTQKMPLPILRAQVAPMQPKAEEGTSGQASAPALDRQTSQEHKTAAVQDLIENPSESTTQYGQREFVAIQRLPITIRVRELPTGRFDLRQ